MTSRPLPRVRVEYPSAERGADDVREHLDSPRCALCGCPDAPKILVEIPWTGKFALRHVCRGHSEHPDHPGETEHENPTETRRCRRCGHIEIMLGRRVCLACSIYDMDGELPEYYSTERVEEVVAAAGGESA